MLTKLKQQQQSFDKNWINSIKTSCHPSKEELKSICDSVKDEFIGSTSLTCHWEVWKIDFSKLAMQSQAVITCLFMVRVWSHESHLNLIVLTQPITVIIYWLQFAQYSIYVKKASVLHAPQNQIHKNMACAISPH